MFMNGVGLFPIQILQGPNVIVIQHGAVTSRAESIWTAARIPRPATCSRSLATRSAAGRATRSSSIDLAADQCLAHHQSGCESGVDTTPHRIPASGQRRLSASGWLAADNTSRTRSPLTIRKRPETVDRQTLLAAATGHRFAGVRLHRQQPARRRGQEPPNCGTLALVATLLAGQPALAHHSFATFDLAELTWWERSRKCNSPARTSGCRCWCRMRGGARPSGASRRGAPGMLLRTGWKATTLSRRPGHDRHTPPEAAPSGSLVCGGRASLRPGRSAPATAIAPLILLLLAWWVLNGRSPCSLSTPTRTPPAWSASPRRGQRMTGRF